MNIRPKQSLAGVIRSNQSLAGSVNVSEVFFDSGEMYDGPYSVTPSMESKTLRTKDKLLSDDVTVLAVPVFRVSNTSGGTTVYIANEV